MATVQHLLDALNASFAFSRAEAWDKTGLQVGDAAADIKSVLVAHEATDAVVSEAAAYDVLCVYHPLIFRPLENLSYSNPTARLAGRCLAHGLHVIAAHTALDNAPQPHALGDHLARALRLENVRVLKPSGHERLSKVVVFVPEPDVERVSVAMWGAGAGHIGQYDKCCFRTHGTGTFRPLEGAKPYLGEIDRLESVEEWRLEMIVRQQHLSAVVSAMLSAHPYEEVAHDVYSLSNTANSWGAARWGELDDPAHSLADYAERVRLALRSPAMRLVASRATVDRVACVPGSGASYIEAAVDAGCDCLVTGDIKHHDALKAQALGLSVIEATHNATERAAVGMLIGALAEVPGVRVDRSAVDTDPYVAGG